MQKKSQFGWPVSSVGNKTITPASLLSVQECGYLFRLLVKEASRAAIRGTNSQTAADLLKSPTRGQLFLLSFEAALGIIFRTSSDFPRHQNSTGASRFDSPHPLLRTSPCSKIKSVVNFLSMVTGAKYVSWRVQPACKREAGVGREMEIYMPRSCGWFVLLKD